MNKIRMEKIVFPILFLLLLLQLYHAGIAKAVEKRKKFSDVGKNIERVLGAPVEIRITRSAFPEAYLEPDGVVALSQGIIDAPLTDDELAFIICHEISHQLAKQTHCDIPPHLLKNPNSCPQWLEEEIRMDISAIRLMERAGYNREASLRVLSLFCPKDVSTTDVRLQTISEYLHPAN